MVKLHRVLVVGSPGSGKSTFARALHTRTGLPLYYLDMLWHLPDHTVVPDDVFDTRLAEILARPRWIIDGNYMRTLPARLAYAGTVFWFDLPPDICLQGIRDRIGQEREDMPWETETELDPEFEDYVRNFRQTKRTMLQEMLLGAQSSGTQLVVFHSRSEATHYLEMMPESF